MADIGTRAIVSGLAFVLLCACMAGAQQIPELKLNTSLERSLSGGQTNEYRIVLDKGQFLHTIVEQKGIDVEVQLLGPDGKRIGHIDSPNSLWGPEPMVALAEVPGEFRLRIVAGNPQAAAGKYEIRVVAVRQATEQDKQHVTANRAVEQGQELLAQGTSASLSDAEEKFKQALYFYRTVHDDYGEAITLFSLGIVQAQKSDSWLVIRTGLWSLIKVHCLSCGLGKISRQKAQLSTISAKSISIVVSGRKPVITTDKRCCFFAIRVISREKVEHLTIWAMLAT